MDKAREQLSLAVEIGKINFIQSQCCIPGELGINKIILTWPEIILKWLNLFHLQ